MKTHKLVIGLLVLSILSLFVETAEAEPKDQIPVTFTTVAPAEITPTEPVTLTPENTKLARMTVIDTSNVKSSRGTGKKAPKSSGLEVVALSSACGWAEHEVRGYNYLGWTLWSFRMRTNFCWNGYYITTQPWRQLWVNSHWGWSWQGITSEWQDWTVQGWSFVDWAQGNFGICYEVCASNRYPWVFHEVYGDGMVAWDFGGR